MIPSDALPREIATGAAEALGETTGAEAIVSVTRLGGGCIHPAGQVRTAGGREAFLKWAQHPGPAGFDVEARGLRALARRGGVRVPRVLGAAGGGPESRGWLLLELVREGQPQPRTPARLGSGLAHLHRPLSPEEGALGPGWDEDGWIGSLPQTNRSEARDWPGFWRDARLRPQWTTARKHFGTGIHPHWDALVQRMDTALEGWEEDGLSLLHGDLWSGNVLTDEQGDPVLIDPAAYRGHREVDLAMMELFGGFGPEVFERYQDERPLSPGYREVRRDVYQLYPLLVHVNLFGGSYADGVRVRIERLAAALA